MISSIFGKTKPINYVFLVVFLFAFYWVVHFYVFGQRYGLEQILVPVIAVSCLILSIFLIDFIVKRNKLVGSTSLALMYYTSLLLVFPEVLLDAYGIFCSFFLLLAIRRILSLRTRKDIKLKLFDASLWVLIASLFYEWAALYFLLIFVAIFFYDATNIRNWLIPFVALITFGLIITALAVWTNDPDNILLHYNFDHDFNLLYFFDWNNSFLMACYVLLVLSAGLTAYLKMGTIGVGKLITMRLILLLFIIGLVINILNSTSEKHPIILTFFPAMIFFTTYFDTIKKDRVKELVLWVSLVMPFIVFLSHLL